MTGLDYSWVTCSSSKESSMSRVSSGSSAKPESSGTGVCLGRGSFARTIIFRMFLAFLSAIRGGSGKMSLSCSLL